MPKIKSVYVCQNCGYETTQWMGQCGSCGEWNSLVETTKSVSTSSKSVSGKSSRAIKPIYLSEVSSDAPKRVLTDIKEFDRVLGGGFVPGQVILLAGDPGIGKSTLLTQIAKSMKNSPVIYVCGEESMYQIKIRADRMGYDAKNLLMLSETNTEMIVASIESYAADKKPGLVIVDSVQTLTSESFMGPAGSVGQVRGACQILTTLAKQLHIPTILVGHVTKEGTVAGPKVLEHIVDTVLYLEGDSQHLYRILKTNKNRFGPVSEIGIFEMSGEGMVEVDNPSKLFLNQRLASASGSCVTVVMEGFRPLLFEIQALTVKTAFGYPRRTTSGYNVNRLQVLIAILEKVCGLNLSNHDVFVNVAGGFKVSEYATDLAVCMAIVSSLKDIPIPDKAVVFGECGLSGEVRRVTYQDKRISEAKKLGFDMIISPDSTKTLVDAVKKILVRSKK